jgi:hypothetical protein
MRAALRHRVTTPVSPINNFKEPLWFAHGRVERRHRKFWSGVRGVVPQDQRKMADVALKDLT